MLSEIKDFLAFYCFSYCAQLSLNIREWRNGYPKPKPLYFILDNEKASNERDAIKNHGFKSFNDSLFFLFPILSMLENLQPKGNKRYPLWKIYKKISDSDNKKLISLNLKKYTISFAEARNIVIDFDKLTSIDDCLIELMRIATEQFRDNNTTRGDINEKYCRELLQFFGSGFVHNRKRAGRVLVLNKDTVLLLTNLSIGSEERLRFNELIKEFESRGVFVDKYTEQELIRFYERVGNVERMSDSGDAVYVRKTI
jgi:DNA phosphorothioation-dependent restriction protein DptG